MPPRAASPPAKGAKAAAAAKDAAPAGPSIEELTAQAQAQKALAEAARVAAERADEAAAAARERAAREAKDRDDVLEHAARELGAAAAKTQALQARIKQLQGEIDATEADCAVLRAAATESLSHAAERDRLLRERVDIDEAARARGAIISRQAAAAAESDAAAEALRERLAEQLARVDELALRCRGGTSLRVYFGAPWLVSQSAARLAAPPPAARGASLCALPGAAALVLFGGRVAGEGAEGPASLGEADSLSLEARAWSRAPGGRHAGREGHAVAALRSAGGVPADALGAAGGAVAVLGGVGADDDAAANREAAAAPCADVAVLAATADGALRWLCAAAELGGDAPPPRAGAAGAATDDDRVYVFGGADAAGHLSAELACLDAAAGAWLPAPGGGRSGAWPSARRDAALCADAGGRGLYLFGGVGADGARLGDLHRYDADAGAWVRLTPAAGEAPPPRSGAALAVAGRYVLLAGGDADADGGAEGANATSALRDAWALDTQRLLWERLQDDDGCGGADGASLCAWRGRTLYRLRPAEDDADAPDGNDAGAPPRLSLLETTEFALPDDVDALISSRRATGGAAAAAAATLALWAESRRGATWLDLAWKPPARNADRCTGYKLMLAPSGATSVRTVYSGRGTSARVGGLRPDTEYICVVKASYGGGGAAHLWSDTRAFRTAVSRAAAPGPAPPPFCTLPSRLGPPAEDPRRSGEGSGGSPSSSPRRRASSGPFGRASDAAADAPPPPLEEDEGGPVAAAAADAAAFFAAAAAARRRNAAPEVTYDDGTEPLDAALQAEAAAAAAAAWDAEEGASAILIAEEDEYEAAMAAMALQDAA